MTAFVVLAWAAVFAALAWRAVRRRRRDRLHALAIYRLHYAIRWDQWLGSWCRRNDDHIDGRAA